MARRSSEAPHRHTVPNSSYASFPCFQEELKLKTNLLKCDTAANGTPESAHENFQVNVSMHDKLKMCFAEMETMKDQFEAKRSKVTRKRLKKERSDTSDTAQSKPRPSSSMAAEDSNRSTIKETRTKLPFDTEKPSTLPSVEENKFKAHLIRTNSKDSMDGTERDMGKSFEVLSHSPAYDETYISPTARPLPPVGMMPTGVNLNSNRRTVSDPFGDLGGLASRTRAERMGDTLAQSGGQSAFGGARHSFEPFTNSPFNWRAAVEKTSYDDLAQSKSAETRRSYDEWLQKLDEVNDISRSTQKRIRNLEKEVINLRTNTDNLLQKPTKHFTSRIPVTTAATASGQPLFTAYHSASQCKKFTDKCTNTDIDLNFMNELLNNWKSKSNQQLDGEENNELRRRRRMTTTIGRSIEIQTEQKICQEKGISTDDWIPPSSTKQFNSEKSYIYNQALSTSKDAPKPSTSQMSILDMPNIEGEQTLHYFDPQVTAGKISTEPVIEMYDSDTSFDAADQTNFEKNMEFIYSQISRRALNQSRLMTRKEVSVQNEYNNLKYRPLRNSSTQTSTERERPKQLLKEATTSKAEKAEAKNQPHMVLPKKLHSSSKIIIERVRMNQKEKNEIQIETDIDNNKVHRTTQVKNQKYRRPKETSTTTAATSHNVPSFKSTTNSQPVSKHIRKVNSDMNVCHSRSIISRPVSAFDLASNSDFDKKKEDNFFNDNKALSSSMIVENHERSRFFQQKKEIYDDIIRKSPSEGYHSSNRIGTPSQDYLIEPPKSFQNMNNSYSEPSWEEVSKSEVTNKMVNETMDAFKEMEMARDGFLTLTNETVIDNTGKQTNITTKSRTIRKYKPKDKTKSNLDLSQAVPSRVDTPTDLARSRSTSQFNLDRYKALQPIDADPPLYYGQVLDDLPQETPRSLVPKEPSQPTMCNFSLVYNCDNNLVFRANFGLAKLPCFETNL